MKINSLQLEFWMALTKPGRRKEKENGKALGKLFC
jgi:hypothetical protein